MTQSSAQVPAGSVYIGIQNAKVRIAPAWYRDCAGRHINLSSGTASPHLALEKACTAAEALAAQAAHTAQGSLLAAAAALAAPEPYAALVQMGLRDHQAARQGS